MSTDGGECFCGTVYSKALKQKVKVVIWYSKDKSKLQSFNSDQSTVFCMINLPS